MDEAIAYDLIDNEKPLDHDALCVAQAGRLLQVGYLEYEIASYGTCVAKNGEISYLIAEKEQTVSDFLRKCYQEKLYPVPVKYFFKRYDLLHQSQAEIKRDFQLYCALKLRADYPKEFFQGLSELTAPLSTNQAFAVLKEITQELDSCFDVDQLKIFESLLDILLCGRHLSVEGYFLLKDWLAQEYEKIAAERILMGSYQRTYSGFIYQKKGQEPKFFCDALHFKAEDKLRQCQKNGFIVTPILTKTYYGQDYTQLNEAKPRFMHDLQKYLLHSYLPLMKWLKTLPPTVERERYMNLLNEAENSDYTQAADALRYYGFLWNVL